jgi:hypothetical protein
MQTVFCWPLFVRAQQSAKRTLDNGGCAKPATRTIAGVDSVVQCNSKSTDIQVQTSALPRCMCGVQLRGRVGREASFVCKGGGLMSCSPQVEGTLTSSKQCGCCRSISIDVFRYDDKMMFKTCDQDQFLFRYHQLCSLARVCTQGLVLFSLLARPYDTTVLKLWE